MNMLRNFFALFLLILSAPALAAYNPAAVTSIGTPAQYQIQPGAADITTQFQTMVSAAALAGGSMRLPCGTYNISSAIVISAISVGFDFGGEARGCVTINQLTNAAPIFKITASIAWGFRFHDFTATWANQQTSSVDSGHASVILECSASSLGSCFNFEMDHVIGYNGSRMLSEDTGSNMWGVNFHDNTRQGSMTGAAIYYPGSTAGEPRVTVRNNYAMITGGVQTEHLYQFVAVGQLLFEHNEVNGQSGSSVPFSTSSINLVNTTNCSGSIIGFNVEGIWTSGGGALIQIGSGGSTLFHMNIDDDYIADHVTDANPVYGVSLFSASQNSESIDIKGLGVQSYSGSSIQILPWNSSQFTRLNSVQAVSWFDGTGASLGHYNPNSALGGTYTGGYPEQDYDLAAPGVSTFLGDQSTTLTVLSNQYQVNDTTITANRVQTLPSAIDPGIEYDFIREAPAPGAFTWSVLDPNSGNNYTCAANTRCFVDYISTGRLQWGIKAAGTLP